MGYEFEEILAKLRHYCAYQERCVQDVREKLGEWKGMQKEESKFISRLEEEGYLNEKRFAANFAAGKFRNNGWGKVKIRYELVRRKIPEEYISAGLDEIPDEEYEERLEELLQRKNSELKEKDSYKRKQKLIAYGMQKGFEVELIKVAIEKIK